MQACAGFTWGMMPHILTGMSKLGCGGGLRKWSAGAECGRQIGVARRGRVIAHRKVTAANVHYHPKQRSSAQAKDGSDGEHDQWFCRGDRCQQSEIELSSRYRQFGLPL